MVISSKTAIEDLHRYLDEQRPFVLDMDGTLLDLAFDDFLWGEALPAALAARDGRPLGTVADAVKRELDAVYGTLAWYSFDHWQHVFDFDIAALERRHADRIRFLPGARGFLEDLSGRGIRAILATNAHPTSLALKRERTGLDRYLEACTSSHEFGHPKESEAFWHAFADAHGLDPAGAVLIDDNERVLDAAHKSGFSTAFCVARPAFGGAHRSASRFPLLGCFSEVYGAA